MKTTRLDYKNVINPHQTPAEIEAQSRFLDKMFAKVFKRDVERNEQRLGPQAATAFAKSRQDMLLGFYHSPRKWSR